MSHAMKLAHAALLTFAVLVAAAPAGVDWLTAIVTVTTVAAIVLLAAVAWGTRPGGRLMR